jgi:GNAT superfamily N-acetyltransferase
MGVVAFTAHHLIAADAPEEWIRAHLDPDVAGPMRPAFLVALAARVGRTADCVDVLLAADRLAGDAELVETARDEHPRVARARAHRVDVRAFEDASGDATVILGRGLALRLEVAIEVDPAARSRGLAARALHEARKLVPNGESLFAQTSPGNAASLRALLAAGFRPIGGEALFY